MAEPKPISATVVICTLNEEQVIERCLDHLGWAAEVIVLDSGSTDRTRELAAARGAVVHQQPWRGFAKQKNDAARLASCEWVLSVDADEIVTQELQQSIRRALAQDPDPRSGFVVDRRHDFLGKALPNSSRPGKRKSLVRLYHRQHGAWDESMEVHEVVRVPGLMLRLRGQLLHWNDFSIGELVVLFDRYAAIEAEELWTSGVRTRLRDLTLRPLARFLWHFVLQGEFRLGMRGAAHAGIKAMSDFLRYSRLYEKQLAAERNSTGADQGHQLHGDAGRTAQQQTWTSFPL